VRITTWHLEQTTQEALIPAKKADVTVTRAEIPSPELNRYLYTAVGGDWHWTDRLQWTWQQWHDWLARDGVETWVAYYKGTPAGYVELDGATTPGEVEIAYFGLLAAFVGKGIGGHLLTAALRRAWQTSPTRVRVHTCSLDGPAALSNYKARGMTVYKTETTEEHVPETPQGPWPGAR
jgi:GNAT superfamily N-acetyltransferase